MIFETDLQIRYFRINLKSPEERAYLDVEKDSPAPQDAEIKAELDA